jgi:hypothetical protein
MDNEEKTETSTNPMYVELTRRGLAFNGYSDCDDPIPEFHQKTVERSKYRPHKGLKELKKMEKRKNATN